MLKTMTRTSLLSAAGVIALLGASAAANAVQLNGTFGFAPIGNLSFVGGASLNLATSVTVPNLEIVNTLPTTYKAQPNDFFTGGMAPLSLGQFIALSSTTIANGGQVGISFFSGLDIYTFTPTTNISLVGSSNANGNFTQFAELGILTSTNPNVTPSVAQLAGNFNQTGAGGAVNGSFTFSTPPDSTVPEPGSVAMLAGLGVSSVGFLARRRRK